MLGDNTTHTKIAIPPCRASTQVTTTTLQKNLTAKIKWYMAPFVKNMNNIFLTKHVYKKKHITQKNIVNKKILIKKHIHKKI